MLPNLRAYLDEHWPDVQVFFRMLDGGDWGRTVWIDGQPTIYLRATLNPVARRVTLAHEIGHLELGPPPVDEDEANELAAIEWAARFLIPDVRALGRLLAVHDVRSAANVLRVTRPVIADRLDVMTDDERQVLAMVLAKAGEAA